MSDHKTELAQTNAIVSRPTAASGVAITAETFNAIGRAAIERAYKPLVLAAAKETDEAATANTRARVEFDAAANRLDDPDDESLVRFVAAIDELRGVMVEAGESLLATTFAATATRVAATPARSITAIINRTREVGGHRALELTATVRLNARQAALAATWQAAEKRLAEATARLAEIATKKQTALREHAAFFPLAFGRVAIAAAPELTGVLAAVYDADYMRAVFGDGGEAEATFAALTATRESETE